MLINCSLVFQPPHWGPLPLRPGYITRKSGRPCPQMTSRRGTRREDIWGCSAPCCPRAVSGIPGTGTHWSPAILHSSFGWTQVCERWFLLLRKLRSTSCAEGSHPVLKQRCPLALGQAPTWRSAPQWWNFRLCNCIAWRSCTPKTYEESYPSRRGSYSNLVQWFWQCRRQRLLQPASFSQVRFSWL